MSSPSVQGQLGQVLIDFSTNGSYPEEDVSAAFVENSALEAALLAVRDAKVALEVSFHIVHPSPAFI